MLVNKIEEHRIRLLIFAAFLVIALGDLILHLYFVQVAKGDVYVNRLRDQTTVAVRLSPARGAIVDRNNIPLAENRASFDIDFYLDELVRHYSKQHHGKVPKIYYEATRKGKKVTLGETDIVEIVNESIDPIAKSLGLQSRPDENDLRNHYRNRRQIPYQFRTDIDFTTLAQFSERNLGVPGIEVAARPVRSYNYGAFASHILGYVGKPDQAEQVGEDGFEYDSVGRLGIEKIMDAQLQGKPGGKILRVNSRGYIDREEGVQQPTVGNSVYLTIDARIQHIVEECMRGVGRGAAIIMDPNNGDILAMVSVPNYDPNDFIPRIPADKWKALNSDPTAPMVNRALSAYAPGSTYKVMISLAGLKYGVITPSTLINSPSAIPIGERLFHNHGDEEFGAINLTEALTHSVNTFFYQLGIRIGIDKIDEMGRLCGMGEATGVLSPESPGILPGPEWMKQSKVYHRERWTTAHTANASIGQGFVQATPLQMSVLMSAVANGGTVYYPRLIKQVADLNGNVQASIPTRVRSELGVKFNDLAAIRQALLSVVEGGTGTKAGGIPNFKVAGKTGTADFTMRLNGQAVKDKRAWFYGFAPYEAPRYVFCVMVEGGDFGGSTSAPIVHDILSRIVAMEQGATVNMSYMTPSIGHFEGVKPITLAPMEGVPAAGSTDVPEAQGDAPASADTGESAPSIMPKRRF